MNSITNIANNVIKILSTPTVTTRFKRGLLALVCCLSFSTAHANDLDDILRNDLGVYYNVTDPSYSWDMRAGVWHGGSVNLRNQILQLQLLGFDAPSFAAGCGGIDLYAGSFSFINKEQFNRLLRSIATNAVGYSFNLALTHVCPTCSQTVETLQRKIQQINQHLGNSCALAQGIVNDSVAALTNTKNNKVSLLATFKGLGDSFASFQGQQAQLKEQLLNDPKVKTSLYGNIAYKALKNAYASRFNQSYLEQILTITGTLVSTPSSRKDPQDKLVTYPGHLFSVQNLINGGDLSLYRCSNANCDKMTVVKASRQSLAQRMKLLYLGSSTSGSSLTNEASTRLSTGTGGVIASYEGNRNDLTPNQERDLALVGKDINAQVRSLAILNPGAARSFVEQAIPLIALQHASNEIDMAFTLVRNALNAVQEDDNLIALYKLLDTNQQRYLQELNSMASSIDKVKLQNYYASLYTTLKEQRGVRAK